MIFSVSTDDALGCELQVTDDRPSAVGGAIAITAARCDPHALIEDKRTFILTGRVRVGGDEPARADVVADGSARRALHELLTACIG